MEIFNRLKEKFKLQKENIYSKIVRVSENEKYRQMMIEEMNEYRKRMEQEDVYYMLGRDEAYALFSDPKKESKNLYSLFEIYKTWDDYGHLPFNVGLLFEDLMADKSRVVGIHRSDSIGQFGNITEDSILQDVFTRGLVNNGDLFSSGAYTKGYINPSKTLSPCDKIFDLVMFAKTGRKHGDKASIITSIPAEYVDDELNIINNSGSKIYDTHDGGIYVKPEYIVGCIYQDHGNCEFYIKDDIINRKTK